MAGGTFEVCRAYGCFAVPTIYTVDGNGYVRHYHGGVTSQEVLSLEIRNLRAWSLLDGPSPDASALASSTTRLFLAARGMDSGIWYRSMDSAGTWSGWTRLPGFTDARPAITAFNNRLYFFCKQQGANSIWYGYYPLTGGVVSGAFSGWLPLDGLTPSAVSLAASSEHLYLAARGMDDSIWHRRMDTAGAQPPDTPNPL